ncbi:hypothetical protein Dxin01_02412 [Deinococcus xinjiangensis]|uniref:Uncharacterized protein n=1 Tax=Deinococcus xinjiangensis TaxID=457454 RepID=A0ABP9VF32_9DEIO
MYSTDLNLTTKARLQETQNVALALPPTKHHFPRWVRRAAKNAMRGLTPKPKPQA